MARQDNRKPQPAKEEAKRPVKNFGPYSTDRNTSVEIAVWSNEVEGDGGSTFTTFNVTVKRSYRVESEWKTNQNFRPHDLPVLLHALQMAYSWILEQKNPSAE